MQAMETEREVILRRWLNERCVVAPAKQEKTMNLFNDWDAWARGLPVEEKPSLTQAGTLAIYGAPASFVKKLTAFGFGRKRAATGSYITGLELKTKSNKSSGVKKGK